VIIFFSKSTSVAIIFRIFAAKIDNKQTETEKK